MLGHYVSNTKMECPQPDAYDAAGYRGVDISLPAYDKFAAALAGGEEIPELQLLYRAWAAEPQQKTTAAQRLYRRQRQTADSKAAAAVSPVQQQAPITRHSDFAKNPEDVVLHAQPSQTLPMALRTVRMDHAIPLPLDAAAIQTIASSRTCSTCCKRCSIATESACKKVQQAFEYCYAASLSAHSAGNGSHSLTTPTSQQHGGIMMCQQQLLPNHLQEQLQQPYSPRNSCRSDNPQRGLQQFCCELQQLQQSQRTSQHQHHTDYNNNGTYCINPNNLLQLKQVAEDCKQLQQLRHVQPLQQQGYLEWQLTADAARPVWQLLKEVPFFSRLAPSLGPAVCQKLLLRRLAAGSTVVQPPCTDNSNTSAGEGISEPLIIVLAGELELVHTTGSATTTSDTAHKATLLGPGSVICSHTFPAAAAALQASTTGSGIQTGCGVQKSAALTVVVGRKLAAELLVLTTDALAAAVKWWGAALLNWSFQSCADGVDAVDSPDFPHFFITQQAQCSMSNRARATSCYSHGEQQQTVGISAACAASSSSVSTSEPATAADVNSGSNIRHEDNADCNYAELHALWRFLPTPVQQMVLRCCSCMLLPAGCLLDSTAAAAPVATTAAGGVGYVLHPSDATGSFTVAAGVLLEVQQLPASGQAVGLTTTAADGNSLAAGGMVSPALSPRWSTLRHHVTGIDWPHAAEGIAHSSGSGSGSPVLSSSPRDSGKSSINGGNAVASSKWDELLLTAGVGQHGRLKTAVFKALTVQEQLECLAAWNGLHIAGQQLAGSRLWLEPPAGSTEVVSSGDRSMARAQRMSRCNSSSQTAMVAAEFCLLAAIEGQQLMLAVGALVRMQQQRQARQAQLLLLKPASAAMTAGSGPAAAAAAALAAASSAATVDANAIAAAAEVHGLAISDAATVTAAGTHCQHAATQRALDETPGGSAHLDCKVHDFISSSLPAEDACTGAASAAACYKDTSSCSTCHAQGLKIGAAGSIATQEQLEQQRLQQQQQQQQEGQLEQQDGCSASQDTGVPEHWLCPCCELQRARMVLCSNMQEQQQQQKQRPGLYGAFQQQMISALLQHFGEDNAAWESSETGNSEEKDKLHEQQHRDMVVAIKQTMLATGPVHSVLPADGRKPVSEGLIPKVQVHSYEIKPPSSTDTALVNTSSSAGAGLNEQRSSRIAATAVAATGGVEWQSGVAAAINENCRSDSVLAASAREAWVRSGLYDPFGMLKPQLVLSQRVHARQQQVRAQEQVLAGCCGASNDQCPRQARELQQDGNFDNKSSQCSTTSAPVCRTAGSAAGVYVSLSAVSNQRCLSGFVMPGGQQIKQRMLDEEQQQLQQARLLNTAGQSSTGTSGTACSRNSRSSMKHAHEGPKSWASGLEDSSDDEEGFRRTGATDGLGVVDYGTSSRGSKHRWTVPAYSSETGYQHGLFDEETGTMYID